MVECLGDVQTVIVVGCVGDVQTTGFLKMLKDVQHKQQQNVMVGDKELIADSKCVSLAYTPCLKKNCANLFFCQNFIKF